MDVLDLINRKNKLFDSDIKTNEDLLCRIIKSSKFLILGGSGSIGRAVVKEIFYRRPKKMHVVDISENNLVELVRDLRSEFGYISGDFKTYALDIDSIEYDFFISQDGSYDYVLNFSALKHVRSEKDPFTLMRMIKVNILNTIKTIEQSIEKGVKKYFCVSTDKAANPVNMMGASKRIMELFLMKYSSDITISTARFANVAFSDGSLLNSFKIRLDKSQPLVGPNDVKRYFVTEKEAGELCLLSSLLGKNNEIFFPKLDENKHLISFETIAKKFLLQKGYNMYNCNSEQEARDYFDKDLQNNIWPCFFSKSNTTGEKFYEEFFVSNEIIDFNKFSDIGIVKNNLDFKLDNLGKFERDINRLLVNNKWLKNDIIRLFKSLLTDFNHLELNKSLDSKM